MNYAVVDLETTMRSPISNESHFAWPDNRIVMAGILNDKECYTTGNLLKYGVIGDFISKLLYDYDECVIVGHNIKFDMLFLLKSKWITVDEFCRMKIFDTQLCEYLLSAQQHTYPSLDDVATKYGGAVKDTTVKEFWDAGTPTESIPESILTKYLVGDLKNTEIVYKKQMELVKSRNMEKLVSSQMHSLKAIILMEYNGLKVDTTYIDHNIGVLQADIDAAEATLRSSIATTTIPINYGDWNWSSPRDVSNLLFGGEYSVVEKDLVGKYKNGKDKFKNVKRSYKMKGCGLVPENHGSVKTKLGWYVTDDAVLKNIDNPISQTILKIRQLSKWKETYYQNMKDLTFLTGFVHPNLNMVSTKTGRLSCNKPNIQNQTMEGGIKDAYVSRFEGGSLVEFDYSQLEMAGLAFISGDRQLEDDINNGVDMHNELYKAMYGRYPTKDERKPFKRLSFGLVYGAGPKTLSEQAGCSIDDAKTFIKVFYNRYRGVAEFHKSIIEDAQKRCKLLAEHTPKGLPRHAYFKRLPTGRVFVFRDYDNEWRGGTSFSPTELKNWPVQGFSTGDVVPFMVGVLSHAIYKNPVFKDSVIPVMTVHDSILFDIKKEVLVDAITYIRNVMNDSTKIFNDWFGTKLNVKLSTGCSVGKSWGKLKEI